MLKFKQKIRSKTRFISPLVFLFLIFSTILFAFINNDANLYKPPEEIELNQDEEKTPKFSALWAWINLTNNDIDGKKFYHNNTIPIIGILFNVTKDGIPGYNVSLYVDGILQSNFTDITNSTGEFRINYTIPYSMNIYSSHKIQVNVTEGALGNIVLNNYFMIDANATSYLDVDSYNLNIPQLAGGYYDLPGFLIYDNKSGIPYQQINSSWYNETLGKFDPPNAPFNTNPDGSFKSIPIPDDNVSKILYLNLTYIGNSTYINGTQKIISINLFRNISCVWNTVGSATEGNQIAIRGQIFARNNSNLNINFTEVRLRMSGASIGTTTTDVNGTFVLIYTIPGGFLGSNIIEVELFNYPNIYSNDSHIINIAGAPIPSADDIGGGDDDDTPPPFFNFFLVFIPIIIGIVAGFIIYGYFYLKKQREESRIVKLPLELRIRNLIILKDTGRLEESLSYLFQSIYMELIDGKYGRRKKVNETIRDFAIISVRDLKLNPTSIYPFIQKVEEIIYARPFIINDKDFYDTVELFSPIYFELTGYNFVLNF